jgi:hypothetical protein
MSNLKEFEIWTGNYNLGQGYHQGSSPEKVGQEKAIDFTVACMKHELKKRLEFIELLEERGNQTEDIISTGLKFDLNLQSLSQPWIGGYYENKEDAQKTFNHR